MRTYYQEIAIRAVKRWTDPVTGKRRQQTRKFYQTLNPFNKDAKGNVKTAEQIRKEIKDKRDAWLAEEP